MHFIQVPPIEQPSQMRFCKLDFFIESIKRNILLTTLTLLTKLSRGYHRRLNKP